MLVSNSKDNHKKFIQGMVACCDDKLIIVSPFLAPDMDYFLSQFDFLSVARVELVTTFKPKDIEQLSKPFQIRDFLKFFFERYPKIVAAVHIDNSLHGKLYFSIGKEGSCMLLTSGNFTENGLVNNHEWGLCIRDEIIINEAVEQVYSGVEYFDLTFNQVKKCCDIANYYLLDNPRWSEKVNIFSDILPSVYSDVDKDNFSPKYFLKPIGHSELPVTLDSRRDFSALHQRLHFSKKVPKGVRKGDVIITTAVGAGSLLSYFRVIGGLHRVSDEQMNLEVWAARWPWYVEGRNQSPSFGSSWWRYNLKRGDLLEEFKSKFPGVPVTHVGGFSLGTINRGNDKVRITKEFGEFLIVRINESVNEV